MRQFEVSIENRIGALADICEVLSKNSINIKAISTELKNSIGIIKFVTDDETSTRNALKKHGLSFSEYEIMPVKLADQPGELANLARGLANLNVDVESVFILNREEGHTEIAFKVNDVKKTREFLG